MFNVEKLIQERRPRFKISKLLPQRYGLDNVLSRYLPHHAFDPINFNLLITPLWT